MGVPSTCPACGYPNASAADICSNCGEHFALPEQTSVSSSAEENKPTPVSQEKFHATSQDPGSRTADKTTPKTSIKNKQPQKKQPGTKYATKAGIVILDSYVRITMRTWLATVLAVFFLACVIFTIFSYFDDSESTQQIQSPVVQDNQATVTPDFAQIDAARKQVELNPDDPKSQLALSHLLHDSGLFDQAIASYKKYLTMVPGDQDARVDLGVCYYSLGSFEDALREMKTAVNANPRHQLGTFNIGIVTLASGDSTGAADWFRKAIDINPADPVAQNAMSILGQISSEHRTEQ